MCIFTKAQVPFLKLENHYDAFSQAIEFTLALSAHLFGQSWRTMSGFDRGKGPLHTFSKDMHSTYLRVQSQREQNG